MNIPILGNTIDGPPWQLVVTISERLSTMHVNDADVLRWKIQAVCWIIPQRCAEESHL
jgi:hypothetical protein